MRNQIVVILLILVCSGALVSQVTSPQVKPFVKVDSPVVALTHVRVIDGTGAAAREDQTIIVSREKSNRFPMQQLRVFQRTRKFLTCTATA